jgi:hypothetical protein
VLALGASACGGSLPDRLIIERDLGTFAYRRYQKTLDVEVAIPGNPAVGHTATYVRRDEGRVVSFATAFVTVYEKGASLTAEAKEQLQGLSYRFAVDDLGPGNAWLLESGNDERWAVWVSGRHLVKLGAPAGEAVPPDLIDAYMDRFPSDLDEAGNAEPDAESAGASRRVKAEQAEDMPLPRHLRENTPK